MRGTFSYKNTERKSFDLKQDDYTVEVFWSCFQRRSGPGILNQRNFSGVVVMVTGKVQRFSNAQNSYYLMATDVVVGSPQPAVSSFRFSGLGVLHGYSSGS